jgi:hypothetical protein
VPRNGPLAELAQIIGGSEFIEAARERLEGRSGRTSSSSERPQLAMDLTWVVLVQPKARGRAGVRGELVARPSR